MPQPPKVGYLDSNGHPYVKIKVWGVDRNLAQEFDAMIDTGYTGFLKLPITVALPLALILRGTTSSTLADGSQSPMLLTSGTIELSGMEVDGIIGIDSGGTPLLGMDFLRRCDHFLVVTSQGVLLWEEQHLRDAAAQAAAAAAPEPPEQPQAPALPANPSEG